MYNNFIKFYDGILLNKLASHSVYLLKKMNNQQTVGTAFKTISIFHIAMCVGLIAIVAVFRFIVKQDNTASTPNQTMEIIGIAVGFIGIISARLLFFKQVKTAHTVSALKDKIAIFRNAFIIQMAILEAAALLNAVLYFITKNDMHFFIAVGIILLMIVRRPTRAMAGMTLFTSMEDKQVIYNDSTPL